MSGCCPIRIVEEIFGAWGKIARSKVPLFLVLLYIASLWGFFVAQAPWLDFHNWDAEFTLQMANEADLKRPWLGKIYLTALYSRALSPEEIARNFEVGFSPELLAKRVQKGLIAFYTFHEGGGGTVHDESSFGAPLDLTLSPPSHIRWLHDPNGVEIVQPAILRSPVPAKKLYAALTGSNELSVETWISPANLVQTGPSRIISYSRDSAQRNFTLGQHNADLHFRLRTPISRAGNIVTLRTKDGFLSSDLFNIVVTYQKGTETLYVNGRQAADRLDLGTDAMLGFAAMKNSAAQIAYCYSYFLPAAFLLSIFFATRMTSLNAAVLTSAAIVAGLVVLAEIFQAWVFQRVIDLPLIGFGAIIGAIGAVSGRMSFNAD